MFVKQQNQRENKLLNEVGEIVDYSIFLITKRRVFPSSLFMTFFLFITSFFLNAPPKSLQFSPTIRSSCGFRLARKQGFDFLKLMISECHVTIKLKNSSSAKILEVLRQSIFGNDFNLLLAYDRQKQHSISLKVKKLHEDKFNRLIQAKSSSKTKCSKQKQQWVKNKSKRVLLFHEKKVLRNFAIALKTLPVMNISSAVEKGLKPLGNSPSVVIARAKITQILSNWRPPTPNLTEEEFKALKQL